MKSHVCGSIMDSVMTNRPFKMNEITIVLQKDLPIFQCRNCSKYLVEDLIMGSVDKILEKVDTSAELEVIRYAA